MYQCFQVQWTSGRAHGTVSGVFDDIQIYSNFAIPQRQERTIDLQGSKWFPICFTPIDYVTLIQVWGWIYSPQPWSVLRPSSVLIQAFPQLILRLHVMLWIHHLDVVLSLIFLQFPWYNVEIEVHQASHLVIKGMQLFWDAKSVLKKYCEQIDQWTTPNKMT